MLPGRNLPDNGPRELLSGTVERVTFHSEESGFAVLRVAVRGRRDLVTVVGQAARIAAGEAIQASGTWVNDATHGLQFKAAHLQMAAPTTAEGMERFLGSGLVKGIGPGLAHRLVAAFGPEVFDVIEQKPERLREVDGIGPVRQGRVIQGWAEQRAVREIMVFLHSNGVGTARAVRIFRTYGSDAIALITENPYRLARDIHGIGFRTADTIAGKLGIEKTALIRARAGISYALTEAMDDGHCGLPREELLGLAEKLLEVEQPILLEALTLELREGSVVADVLDDEPAVFLGGLHRAESKIATSLLALTKGDPPWRPIDAAKAVPWVEAKLGVTLAPSQQEALRLALGSKVLVITGGPGVGKTTLVNAILKTLLVKGVKVALTAPTGRAAKRLSESTGLEAKTIHRLLEVDPRSGGFRRGENTPLEADLLVVDEVSMVDVPLMRSLLAALPGEAALLLVGDVDQLPSVGPGQVLRDVIDSGTIPVVRLTEVFRQAAGSRIVTNAHRINQGRMPDLTRQEDSDFYFIDADEPDVVLAKLIRVVQERIPKRFGLDPIRDVQVLCPMNRGGLGARSVNLKLQSVLNPPGEKRVERFGSVYSLGDKVMQVENDYTKEVYNGDIGVVTGIDPENQTVSISFDGRDVAYDFGELDLVTLAYATTIHKSQGSEYPAVVIPLTTQHYPMLKRNLVYTAITRGRKLVVLIGQKKALAMAVKNDTSRRRYTKLRERLADRSTVST
jgi:exodeoxyribonuclease V alpha subunit